MRQVISELPALSAEWWPMHCVVAGAVRIMQCVLSGSRQSLCVGAVCELCACSMEAHNLPTSEDHVSVSTLHCAPFSPYCYDRWSPFGKARWVQRYSGTVVQWYSVWLMTCRQIVAVLCG